MTQTLAISDTITTLAQAEEKLGLQPAEANFFSEWTARPQLMEAEEARLDVIKRRFLYHRKHGYLAEGAVNFVILSPLLEMAGFYDPPFLLRSEVSVKLAIEAEDQILRGRIDALVIQEQFWLLLIESKQTAFSLDVALPQALTYMACNPRTQQPVVYGLVSNGGYFMFLKVNRQTGQYAFSNDFSLYRSENELVNVLSILKVFSQSII